MKIQGVEGGRIDDLGWFISTTSSRLLAFDSTLSGIDASSEEILLARFTIDSSGQQGTGVFIKADESIVNDITGMVQFEIVLENNGCFPYDCAHHCSDASNAESDDANEGFVEDAYGGCCAANSGGVVGPALWYVDGDEDGLGTAAEDTVSACVCPEGASADCVASSVDGYVPNADDEDDACGSNEHDECGVCDGGNTQDACLDSDDCAIMDCDGLCDADSTATMTNYYLDEDGDTLGVGDAVSYCSSSVTQLSGTAEEQYETASPTPSVSPSSSR
jgi:hypothetical protein